jgi:hypothetical protein
MKESTCLTQLKKWLESDPKNAWNFGNNAALEAKLMRGTSLPFSALAEHQEKALLEVREKPLFYKITDSPVFKGMKSRFTAPKPFDMFILNSPGFVVVFRYIKGQREKERQAVIVDIIDWVKLREGSERKSATWEMLAAVGRIIKPWDC